ncbi:hypothetical protein CW676_05065 [Macrococcoides caseolyticum]|uniref:hypothetical protein n=1 Tax=Macrococcoides caseolyticum TaxID=69966 RepID=UPI000C33C539|nr:hypothetical protein [Macrococcus caseolyticus]PKE06636.1 hypothetical protein CW692_07440 [Macrococcus caseolyticus]PKE24409.1 hypothetical protein CW689_04560 [Macrococcus caseolyticus]PKE53651.1 hypothetical protein CW676_05065 [Macrococcus caseolyticus]PKF38794.1 hypothetical protein CW681_05395 [Macrococcus caseolyticus]
MFQSIIDNQKENLVDISDYGEVTLGKWKRDYIELSGKRFSNPYLLGLQRKGFIYITTDKKNICHEKFVKLDEVNLERQGKLLGTFDESYSSITEEIISRLIDNFVDKGNMNSLTYRFNMFDINGKKVSGTTSNNFIANGFLEAILSKHNPRADMSEHYDDENYYFPIDHKEYERKIVNGYDNLLIFEELIEYYKKVGVDEVTAKEFIIQQAAFDILISNKDRRINSTNTIFLVSTETTIPVNIDYGRALPFTFHKEENEKYSNMSTDQWNEIIRELSVKDIGEDGLISAGLNMKENIEFLQENGLKKIKINVKQLKIDLEDSCERIKGLKPELYEFAKIKAGMVLSRLQNETISELWEEYHEEDHL